MSRLKSCLDSVKMMFIIVISYLFTVTPLVVTYEAQSPVATIASTKPRCLLPPYPENGGYVVTNKREATPGQEIGAAELAFTCKPRYTLVGSNIVPCVFGDWYLDTPECLPWCEVEKQTSKGRIIVHKAGNAGTHRCLIDQPPEARSASSSDIPECGSPTPCPTSAIAGGRRYEECELPWHVGIFQKTTTPYMQICGGSIISNYVVISASKAISIYPAAHCFWDDVEKQLPASRYAVDAGTGHRSWDHKSHFSQKTDVEEIKIPPRYQGSTTSFQEDIALVIVATAFVFNLYVVPVCLDFNRELDSKQLQEGNLGKISGWGLTAKDGVESPVLQVAEMPYISIERCIRECQPGFLNYITSDKFCAGYVNNGTALCRGDSGGGLAFAEITDGFPRYNLRGIASTAPTDDHLCNVNTWATFTHVLRHEHFIKQFL